MMNAMTRLRNANNAKPQILLVTFCMLTCLGQNKVFAQAATASDLIENRSENEYLLPVEAMPVSSHSTIELPRLYTGTIKATRSSELGFKRIGRIENVHIDDGQRVRKGQVLAELDTASLKASFQVTLAEKMAAQARLDELIAGPRRQTIESMKASIAETEALRDQLQITYGRRSRLQNSDAIAAQDVDDSRLQLLAIENRLTSQRKQLEELQEGTRKEQIDAQKSVVAQLQASLNAIQVEIDESQLLAPYDAIVSRLILDAGSIVSPGAAVARIIEVAPPEAWIGVPSDILDQIDGQKPHKITIRGNVLQGRLKSILPELDNSTRTHTVVFALDETSDLKLNQEIGQIAQLELTMKSTQQGFWLPMTALTRGVRGLWAAYVADPTDIENNIYTLRRCEVEILQVDSSQVLVRGTLSDGDLVIIGGVQKLTNDQRVQLMPPEPKLDASN